MKLACCTVLAMVAACSGRPIEGRELKVFDCSDSANTHHLASCDSSSWDVDVAAEVVYLRDRRSLREISLLSGESRLVANVSLASIAVGREYVFGLLEDRPYGADHRAPYAGLAVVAIPRAGGAMREIYRIPKGVVKLTPYGSSNVVIYHYMSTSPGGILLSVNLGEVRVVSESGGTTFPVTIGAHAYVGLPQGRVARVSPSGLQVINPEANDRACDQAISLVADGEDGAVLSCASNHAYDTTTCRYVALYGGGWPINCDRKQGMILLGVSRPFVYVSYELSSTNLYVIPIRGGRPLAMNNGDCLATRMVATSSSIVLEETCPPMGPMAMDHLKVIRPIGR